MSLNAHRGKNSVVKALGEEGTGALQDVLQPAVMQDCSDGRLGVLNGVNGLAS